MANLYVTAVPTADLNRNTEWFMYPGIPGRTWSLYFVPYNEQKSCTANTLIDLVESLELITFLSVESLSYDPITYHFFHWKKGTPFAEDQGIYNRLTWWEQIDKGKQLTRNRKFLTVVPVVLNGVQFQLSWKQSLNVKNLILYLIASHTTDYQHPMLIFNTLAVIVLVVAKFPNMHKVRIFGINADK
ncbi:hypothetical protein POTOM_008506 [Populus tomentosa]|uniref:Uncharacterized protein n=1 Tax=Populus tomentosa TaxID=118781 RepID=A0A8X8AM77_POPTO|nr:hypothetical protein POTOM_008506 [Populus tomentosa]